MLLTQQETHVRYASRQQNLLACMYTMIDTVLACMLTFLSFLYHHKLTL